MLEGLDERAVKRLGGKAWDKIRRQFDRINEALLSVSPSTTGSLTTVYIKYSAPETANQPYAVLWVKKSTQLILGLALPHDYESAGLTTPPGNLTYSGLNAYITITPDMDVPADIDRWASDAYNHLKK